MITKKILNTTFLGLFLVLLTLSMPLTHATHESIQMTMVKSSPSSTFYYEGLSIVAGIDTAALVNLNIVGGASAERVSGASFDQVKNWIFVLSDQEDYADYMQRRPFRAPDNATLLLQVPNTSTGVAIALEVAEQFAAHYDVNLWIAGMRTLPDSYVFTFNGGMNNSAFQTLLDEMTDDLDDGFITAIDKSKVTNAPVKAVIVGGGDYAIRSIMYVDDNAITGSYSLTSANLFGGAIEASENPALDKYSVVSVRFPYTITPSVITPMPDNVAPQITGKMDWVLQYPHNIMRADLDFVITFDIDHAALVSSPRVSVNMQYDHDLLNDEGILEMEYELKNTGTQAAENILISYPLGPYFMEVLENKPILPRLKDNIEVNESIHTVTNVSVSITYTGPLFNDYEDQEYEQEMLALTGWYTYKDNGSWVDWDEAATDPIVKSDSRTINVYGLEGTVTVAITLHNPDGTSKILVAKAQEFLEDINLTDYAYTDLPDVFDDYKEALVDTMEEAALELYLLLYTNQTLFDPVWNDFELVTRVVGEPGYEQVEYFLEAEVAHLDINEELVISWSLENITAPWMTFGVMRSDWYNEIDGSNGIELITTQHDFYEMMQTLLGFASGAGSLAYGRPISWTWEDMGEIYSLSYGARFKYENANGFEYFGFSNGLNLQLVDDEAVLNVYVELDDVGYRVGDEVTISGYIRNTGDIDAHEVYLNLFHGRLGNNWAIEDMKLFHSEEIAIGTDVIAPGEQHNFSVTVEANSYLGIHPVFATVEFISDYGQEPLEVYNFWNPDQTAEWKGAAETNNIVVSNMAWALLLPPTEEMKPAFPVPIMDITTDFSLDITKTPWEIQIVVTIENVGESSSNVVAVQYYNADDLELIARSTTQGAITTQTHGFVGIVAVGGVTLAPTESFAVTMKWKIITEDAVFIPPIVVIYDSIYENELGESKEAHAAQAMFNALDGSTQDASDWEDYGTSNTVGSSAGANIDTGDGDKERRLSFELFTSLTIVALTVFILKKKR